MPPASTSATGPAVRAATGWLSIIHCDVNSLLGGLAWRLGFEIDGRRLVAFGRRRRRRRATGPIAQLSGSHRGGRSCPHRGVGLRPQRAVLSIGPGQPTPGASRPPPRPNLPPVVSLFPVPLLSLPTVVQVDAVRELAGAGSLAVDGEGPGPHDTAVSPGAAASV